MIRHIPSFILHQYESITFSGSFSGYALLFDIADFTTIGDMLQGHGKPGAEALSRFLDEVFHTPIGICGRNGGFVSVFAGDAVCVLFPDGEPAYVLKAVCEIRDHFAQNTSFETQFGDVDVKVRMTVTTGKIEWRIFVNDVQNEYVFFGEPIREMAKLSAQKAVVMYSQKAAENAGFAHLEQQGDGYRLLSDATAPQTAEKHLAFDFVPATYDAFLQASIRDVKPSNEIRSAAYCFANLEGIPEDEREDAIAALASLADTYGGFVNKLDATDKGLLALLLFGLPRSEGKTLERICSFTLEATAQVPQIALGISCGAVFAGYTGSGDVSEYTALGHPVNLAARLMSKAQLGEVLTDHYLQKELHKSFMFEAIGEIALKGLAEPIQHYRLEAKLQRSHTQHATTFVGRDVELATIHTAVESHLQDGANLAYHVVGDAGVGKTRLISEIMQGLIIDDHHAFHLHCDAILAKPLEIIKQLVRQYFHYDSTQNSEQGIVAFQSQWRMLAGDDAELNRIESIIASLLGYEWEGSVWSVLPGNEKPSQLRNAFLRFIQVLTEQNPVIIHLDDPQWIDDSSAEFLRYLGEKQVSPLIILAACRYKDDGSVPDLELPNVTSDTMELSTLTEEGCASLIATLLGLDDVPEATVAAINAKAAGNPFFTEQLVAWLTENDRLDASGALTEELDLSATFSISDVIGSRVDRLTAEVRECVYQASVLGMEFDVAVLSQMISREPQSELDDGERSRIWEVLDEIRYIFSHILIRDIVYQRMMNDRLKELHRIAAEAMEAVYRDDEKQLNEHAEEIAVHYHTGGAEVRAAEFFYRSGDWYKVNFQFDKGKENLQKAIDIREKVLGPEDPNTALSLNNLAALYHNMGKYDQAEVLFFRVLEIYQKVLDLDHPSTAMSLNNLGELYTKQGKHEQAETLLLRALEIRKKALGQEHPSTARTINNLSNLYKAQGMHKLAEPLQLRALEIKEKALGPEHPSTAMSLNNLANVHIAQGKYELAVPLQLRALEIREKVLGPDHPSTAMSLNNLANMHCEQGKYELAEPLQLRALGIKEKVLGLDHPSTAMSLINLAEICKAQSKYEQAESLLLQALNIYEKVLGLENPYAAISLTNLAEIHKAQGKNEQAESLFQQALHLFEKVLGPEHPYTAMSLNNLAELYRLCGKYNRAAPLYLRALEIRDRVLGPEHPDSIVTIESIISLYEQTGDTEQAAKYRAMLEEADKPVEE